MPNLWFIGDTHFNHDNVIQYSARPFVDLDDMTSNFIMNWNRRVAKGDDVYHLGDFALSWGKKDTATIDEILSMLNGHKHLIIGNHDRAEVVNNKQWASVRHYHELKIDLGGIHKQRIVLCHYAMRVWNQMHRGAWMLHGHSHGNLVDIGGKIMDVGVDCHNYQPIHINEVQEYMRDRDIISYDHHTPTKKG